MTMKILRISGIITYYMIAQNIKNFLIAEKCEFKNV